MKNLSRQLGQHDSEAFTACEAINGFLLVDKPAGITSHDVVDVVRRVTGIRRVGHSGTLDPFATGLLTLGVGAATKQLGNLQGLPKHYIATMYLGATSDTGDPTGVVTIITNSQLLISKLEVERLLPKFTGPIFQIPPMYSAKKVGGKKLYELAREGKIIERTPHQITIHKLELRSFHWPLAEIEVHCSSGTYIRTLVEDIGKALGSGAYTQILQRLSIGPYRIEDAQTLHALTKENWRAHLLPIDPTLDKITATAYPASTDTLHR